MTLKKIRQLEGKICLLLIIIFIAYSCNLKNKDFKNPIQVSKSIKESKEKKVFLNKFIISHLKRYNHSFKFPIKNIWLEKHWHLELDSTKKEIIVIDEEFPKNIVFSLKNIDSFFSSDNNTEGKWVIWLGEKEIPSSSIDGMIIIPVSNVLLNDSTTITIYKQKTPNDFKREIEKLFSFTIKSTHF